MISVLQNYVVSLAAIAALTVLAALGKVSGDTALPLIVALAGVHVGSAISGSSSTSPTADDVALALLKHDTAPAPKSPPSV